MPGPTPTLSHRVPLRWGQVRPLSTEFDYSADSDLAPYQNFQVQQSHVIKSTTSRRALRHANYQNLHMYKQATAPCVLRDLASKQQPTTRPRQGQDDAQGLITSQHANYSTRPRTKLSHVSFFIYSGYYSYATVAISSSLNGC